MSGRIDEFASRVAERVWLLVSAKITARVELEVARTQAELLAQAAAFRRGGGKLGEEIARRLEHASEELVRELSSGIGELVWTSDLRTAAFADVATRSVSPDESDAKGKRRRGRPKTVLGSAAQDCDAMPCDETLADMPEVSDEERTGACDPAGTDQVPDLSTEDIQR